MYIADHWSKLLTTGIFCLLTYFIVLPQSTAQKITALETRWRDSFKEWNIFTDQEGLEGRLFMTWTLTDDWSEWQYDLGENQGSIRLKYAPDPNLWEFRSGNEVITARTVWSNELAEWRFTNGEYIIQLRMKYNELPFVWYTDGERHGFIDIFTEYENDPTVWLLEDQLNEDISVLYKMALIFVAIYHSSPKI